jgi:hypothetical protein
MQSTTGTTRFTMGLWNLACLLGKVTAIVKIWPLETLCRYLVGRRPKGYISGYTAKWPHFTSQVNLHARVTQA